MWGVLLLDIRDSDSVCIATMKTVLLGVIREEGGVALLATFVWRDLLLTIPKFNAHSEDESLHGMQLETEAFIQKTIYI